MERNQLTQSQFCAMLMNNGHALEFLEKVMGDTTHEDHLIAIDRAVYLKHAPELDQTLSWDIGTALVLEVYLRQSDRVVVYKKKEVGSLFRFEPGTSSNVEGIALVDYLHKIPSMMTLNAAQIVELEQLLNKAGDTLGMSIPFVPPATEEEKVAVLEELALSILQTKPKAYYQKYLDMMKAAGKPLTMTQQEFLQFAQQTLSS